MTEKSSIKALWQWLKKPLQVSLFRAVILSSLFFALFGNIAFWKKIISLMEWTHAIDYVQFTSFFIFIFCALLIIFSILFWRFSFKPVLIALILISAGVNYFCITYSIYIDREMIQNVFRTDSHEAFALFTPQFLGWVTLFGILPSLFVLKVKLTNHYSILKQIFHKCITILLCVLIILAASIPIYKQYASFFRNNREVAKLITPTNYLHAAYKYAQLHLESTKPFVPIGLDAQLTLPAQSQKPTLFIMVVGEASRAQNFSLLGYQRQTNPLLSKQSDLLVFQNVTSCGTSTAVSVPCMFSNMPRSNYSASKASHQESVLDIIQRAGVNVVWRENNTGCQGLCTNILYQKVRSEQ
ncbi:MAG: phosphoethanolamine transferase, partial [Saezia sp.]